MDNYIEIRTHFRLPCNYLGHQNSSSKPGNLCNSDFFFFFFLNWDNIICTQYNFKPHIYPTNHFLKYKRASSFTASRSISKPNLPHICIRCTVFLKQIFQFLENEAEREGEKPSLAQITSHCCQKTKIMVEGCLPSFCHDVIKI